MGRSHSRALSGGSYDPNLGSYSLDTIKLISFKCSIQGFLVHLYILRSSPKFNFRTFSSSPKENLVQSSSILTFSPTELIFCVWHSIFKFIHTTALISTSFLLLPNSIPLYGYTTFSLSICQLMSIKAVSTSWLLWLLLLWIFLEVSVFHIRPKIPYAGLAVQSFQRSTEITKYPWNS